MPRIIHEDPWLLVVHKPAGLACHAAQGVEGNDLLSELRTRFGAVVLIHRLDRGTSGLLLVSRRAEANRALQRQLEDHAIERRYEALLKGQLAGDRAVRRPIAKRSAGRAALSRKPGKDALPACSHFELLDGYGRGCRVRVRLETGRKHQIRIHAASIGHPIVGDSRYGGPAAPRLGLHARRLIFRHPEDGRVLDFDVPPPADFEELAR